MADCRNRGSDAAFAGMRLARSKDLTYARQELDLRILEQVRLEGGVFVEAGANDGVRESNTLLLERHHGWTGLLIEPIPPLAEMCRRNRPTALVEEAALVASDYRASTIRMRYSNLMSVVDGARGRPDADAAWAGLGRALYADPHGIPARWFRVPARTLSSILTTHGMGRIDLLVLDVEGYEPTALRGLDLARHQPRFIAVEAWNPGDIESVLGSQYEFVANLCAHEVAGLRWHDALYRVREDGCR